MLLNSKEDKEMIHEINARTATKWANALQVAHDFLIENMQYGDDWKEECSVIEEILHFLAKIEAQDNSNDSIYLYGMRNRGFSIGCQPMDGLVGLSSMERSEYYDVIMYARKLDNKEMQDFELDYLGMENNQ